MVSQAKRQVIAAVLAILCLTEQAASITCKGASSAIIGYGANCMTNSDKASAAESQSCLRIAFKDVVRTCSSASCASYNVRVKPGTFSDADNIIWSISGCYSNSIQFKFCTTEPATTTTGPTVVTTTTTAPATTTTTQPTTSTANITTETTTTETTTTATTSTTTETTESTTTQTTTSTEAPTTTTTEAVPTTSQPLVPFEGCLTGVAALGGTCAKTTTEKEIDATYTKTGETTGTTVKLLVTILGCCSENNCEVDDGVKRDFTCKFDDADGNTADIDCATGCFAVLLDSKVYRGCLPDIPLDTLDVPDNVLACTTTEADCKDVDNKDACVRCCKGKKCNTWNTQEDFLKAIDDDDDDSGAPLSVCSSIVLVATLLLSHFY